MSRSRRSGPDARAPLGAPRRAAPSELGKERERAFFAELRALYADVDAAHAGSACPGTTECCRFGITGREPYVTSLELALVTRAVRDRGGPLAPRRRALPMLEEARDDERICPLLDATGRCSVYASRPLGCRTFWCHRSETSRDVSHDERLDFVRRLKELGARHEPEGELGRPFFRAIRAITSRRD